MIAQRLPVRHFRLLIALLLAVIGLHAIPSAPFPLQPDGGAAFSASSAEVALPVRQEVAAELRILPIPDPHRAPIADRLWDDPDGASAPFWPLPSAQAPPVGEVRAPQSLSRAPPAS